MIIFVNFLLLEMKTEQEYFIMNDKTNTKDM